MTEMQYIEWKLSEKFSPVSKREDLLLSVVHAYDSCC